MTGYDWHVTAILLVACWAVARYVIHVNEKASRPVFRSRRVHGWLKKLSQEGYSLDENGRVVCSTCGPHDCGQCSGASGVVGLTLEEYRQMKGWT